MSKLFLCDKKHLINNTRKRFFWLLLVPVFFVAFPSSGITNNALSSYIGSNSYACSYDGIGNRTSATENNAVTTYTSNLVNQYTLVNAAIPTYDADGNMTNYNGWNYTYNGENRLIVAENAATGVRVEADYDYMGRRLFKKVMMVRLIPKIL